MTHLNIQQGQNIEVVSTNLIKKLYEAALSVPEPLEGEQDAAYMSGNLQVDRSYRSYVQYLTDRFHDLHINVTDSYYIPFEDSAVLNVLLANNIGSDGIGVTEAEAANATLTTAMLKNNKDITSFDEFKYFTKANTNPPNQLFMGCSNLSSVDLSNVTTLSSEEFRETALTSVVLPENVTTISNNCFQKNSSLLSVSAPGVQVINSQAFNQCTGLTSFSDFSNVITFGEQCFRNCSQLQLSASALINATSMGKYAFSGCTLLTGELNLPNLTGVLGEHAFENTHISSISSLGSVTEIGEYAFGNTNISSITIPNSVKKCGCNIVHNTIVPEIIFPEGVEKITGGQFYTKNNSLTYIEIPSTVTNMGIFFHSSLGGSQDNLCTVVIKATTPPELNYYSSNSSQIALTRGDKFAGIYVPDSSLTAYQNGANAWQHSSIQAKLKPISQLQTDNPTAWAKYNRTSTV